MALIYAMSDIHGETELLKEMLKLVDLQDENNKLILLGDYVDYKSKNYDILTFIKNFQESYRNQVVILAGNHEFMLLEYIASKQVPFNDNVIIDWLKSLPYYFETDTQIFVHAGIDEEAEELWKYGSENYYFCSKYPHTTGKFIKDIIAGHISTSEISGKSNYHKVYWDKQSHFFIDGDTPISKIIPILKYDTILRKYSSFEKIKQADGSILWQEYDI